MGERPVRSKSGKSRFLNGVARQEAALSLPVVGVGFDVVATAESSRSCGRWPWSRWWPVGGPGLSLCEPTMALTHIAHLRLVQRFKHNKQINKCERHRRGGEVGVHGTPHTVIHQ
jgi:hypothetical protein